jgi:hypothetical protein
MVDDDEDEEPFSAGSQIDVNPASRQDGTPRRAQPGGRFPSDIQVNTQRGLQATHSHSSVSSQEQSSDARGITSAGPLAGTTVPAAEHSESQNETGYGGINGTPIDDIHSKAARANQEAESDGVNPYTSEPVERPRPVEPSHAQTLVAPIVIPGQEQRREEQPLSTKQQDDLAPRQDPGHAALAPETYTTESPQNHADKGHTNFVAMGAAGVPKSESAFETDSQLLAETPASETPTRPSGQNIRADSVQTISNLHIPGGYPRPSVSEL